MKMRTEKTNRNCNSIRRSMGRTLTDMKFKRLTPSIARADMKFNRIKLTIVRVSWKHRISAAFEDKTQVLTVNVSPGASERVLYWP